MSTYKTVALILTPLLLLGRVDQLVERDKELVEVSGVDDSQKLMSISRGDSSIEFGYKNRTEAFYSRSLNLFSESSLDQIFYAQTTNDFNLSANIEGSSLSSMLSIRNKSRWGNPNSIARTTASTVNIADSVVGSHSHSIPRQILWVRESWVDLSVNKIFGVKSFRRTKY